MLPVGKLEGIVCLIKMIKAVSGPDVLTPSREIESMSSNSVLYHQRGWGRLVKITGALQLVC